MCRFVGVGFNVLVYLDGRCGQGREDEVVESCVMPVGDALQQPVVLVRWVVGDSEKLRGCTAEAEEHEHRSYPCGGPAGQHGERADA